MKKRLSLFLIMMLALVVPVRAELLQTDLSIFGMD
jgi:hypothetical protein